MIQPIYQYGKALAITSSQVIETVPGNLQAVIISSHSSGTIKFWDNSSSGSGTVLVDTYTYPAGSSVVNFVGAKFINGLYADIASTTQKITVVWNVYVGG